ncbi:MAG: hypothetical protein ACTSQY_07280 [Candidatus Odinarchaeia archaeon]
MQLRQKSDSCNIIMKYLIRRAIRNGYADKDFYQSLKNFKDKFELY